jgi:nucleoside-diphosphate-sugar epimerase
MKILMTGGTGCIGAATVFKLLSAVNAADIRQIVLTSRSGNPKLLQLWQRDGLDARIQFLNVDLADAAAMDTAVKDYRPTHVVHLGALQSPACDADPIRGMQVNLGGTMGLLDSVRNHCPQLERFVFASSAAVYGKRAIYDTPTVGETATLAPPNLYGVWKEAGEQLCRLFHEQSGISTVCLRLNTTYGPGRDVGKTSAPTLAMKRVALGAVSGQTLPFQMPYQGKENYHYVEDVGAHFAGVCLQPFSGFGAFNIKGRTIEIADFLQAIRRAADDSDCGQFCDFKIAADAPENLFVYDLEDEAIDGAFRDMPRTPIETGVQLSLSKFREMAKAGELTAAG